MHCLISTSISAERLAREKKKGVDAGMGAGSILQKISLRAKVCAKGGGH